MMPSITITLIISLLVGILVAQRFRVFILLPIIGLALILTIGGGIVWKLDGWSIFWLAVTAVVALQVGYHCAAGIRYLVAARRARREGTTSAPTPTASTQHPAQ